MEVEVEVEVEVMVMVVVVVEAEVQVVVEVEVVMLKGAATHTVSFPGHKSRDELDALAAPNLFGVGPKTMAELGAMSALALSGPTWTRRLRKQEEQFAEGASMPT